MGTSQSRTLTRSQTSVSPPSPPPQSRLQQRTLRWSASQLDNRVYHHYHHRRGEYTSAVVNARAQAFGHRDSSSDDDDDDAHFNLDRQELPSDSSSGSDYSETESEPSTQHHYQQKKNSTDSLVMLPSALDPRGRKIRRVTTEVVDSDEQLLLVKRRASAAKAIALRGSQQPLSTSNSNSRISKREPESQRSALPSVTPADFAYLKVIGVGAWGKVVLVRNRHDGKLYAMKVISKRSVKENNLAEKILSERDVLGGTHHHALVHLHWAFQTKTSLYLVMDYCPGGELSVHLHEAERFSEEVATFYAAEIVLALEHLHRHGIIYRDLKPENLLLTASGHVKLVDFGISKFGITEPTMGATTMCGSYEYLAPEVFLSKEYGTAVDWWSFGVVFYEMLTGLPPWYSQNPQTMRKHILKKPLVFPSYVSEEARGLLRGLLHQDPLRRLGSRDGSLEVKCHAFFRNVDWQLVTFREIFPPIQPCCSLQSIENASNFDVEFTRMSVGSVDASSSQTGSACDEFTDFNFEAPEALHIEYGYARDLGGQSSAGMYAKQSQRGRQKRTAHLKKTALFARSALTVCEDECSAQSVSSLAISPVEEDSPRHPLAHSLDHHIAMSAEHVPWFAAVMCLLQYSILITFGHLRDLCAQLSGRSRFQSERRKRGFAKLLIAWENFYTQRLYYRVRDVFNRPVAGAPGAHIDLIKRRTLDDNKTFIQSNSDLQRCLNLGSYNYLGFADDWMKTCSETVFGALEQFGPASSVPPMELGTALVHEELESTVAEFVGKPTAIVFNMGYATNSTSIPALMGKGTLIVSDALNHTSIVNGARASGATVGVFRHNDSKHLEQVLRQKIAEGQPRSGRAWKKVMVMVEGIYSMEGEIVDLRAIVDVSKKYKAYIYVDEAHSIGALGKTGRGICEYCGVDPSEIDILMGTFTKSFGGMGGYIAASKEVIEFIRVSSAGAIYATGLSPVIAQQTLTAFNIISGKDGTNIGQQKLTALRENSNYFRQKLMEMGVATLGNFDSPVIPVMLFYMSKVGEFSRECLKRDVAVVTVGFPATPLLESRVRFCISATHTKEDMDRGLKVIKEVSEICHVRYATHVLG